MSKIDASGASEFEYSPGRPNLFRMMRYKQDLIAAKGVKDGLTAFRERLGWPRQDVVRRLRLESERDYASTDAVYFLETGVSGVPFVNQPPVVHGEGNHRSLSGVTRTQYVACLRNARVRGRSAGVVTDNRLLLDFQDDELDRVDEEFEWDPSIFYAEDGIAWYLPAPDEETPLRLPEAFNLLGAHTDFFGHWMCEYLPKYAAAVLSGVLPQVPILIDAHMPAAHRQSLELLYPERGPIIEIEPFRSVMVQDLWVAPDLSYYPLYDPGSGRFEWDAITVSPERIGPVMQELRTRAAAHLGDHTILAKKVFLARKPFRHRKLVTAEQIHDEARRHGFLVIYPEEFSFGEQVGWMRGATEILASEGSAAFLVEFARPGTRFCMLSHPITEPHSDFNEIFRALDIEMTVMTGPIADFNARTPHDSDYRIDPAEFRKFLEVWLSRDCGR